MEKFANKSVHFLNNGKLAVGIKLNKDSLEIVENLKSIGYVLFHHRNDNNQHLFAIKGDCQVKTKREIEEDRYKNIGTTEMYIAVDLNTSSELDSTGLLSSKKKFIPETRYDAQYSTINELSERQ